MATRKRIKKYGWSNLVNNFGLVDLSEDELTDNNDSDRESYFEDDTNTIASSCSKHHS